MPPGSRFDRYVTAPDGIVVDSAGLGGNAVRRMGLGMGTSIFFTRSAALTAAIAGLRQSAPMICGKLRKKLRTFGESCRDRESQLRVRVNSLRTRFDSSADHAPRTPPAGGFALLLREGERAYG